jgi:MFS family permease
MIAGTWGELWRSGLFGRFVLLCLGVWLHAADSLVTATILPAILNDMGGVAYVGWTIALYQIGALVAGAATALVCQRAGITRVLSGAALLYGLGCALAALAPSMPVLLVARLVQGVGGGTLIALTYVAIQQSFPEHLWGRLFAVVALIWGGGALLGPLIGGVFAQLGVWRLAFWCFAAQAALVWAIAATDPAAPPSPRRETAGFPARVIGLLSVAALLIAEAGAVRHWAVALLLCVAGAGLLVLAALLDRRASVRLLPAQLLDFRHPVGAGLLMVFALSIATTGFWAYGPLLLKIMFGTEPLISGLILAGEALAWSAATMAVSGASAAAGRRLIRLGAILVSLGVAGFAVTVPAGSLPGMVICAILQGVGFGLSWPAIVQRVVRNADPDEQILASSAPGTMQNIGYAIGAAASGIAANAAGLAEGVSVAAAQAAGVGVFAGFIPALAVGLLAAWRFTARGTGGDR